MPEWIPRTLERELQAATRGLELFPVWLLLGARQVGKSSLLQHCGPKRQFISLDDLDVRARANSDPELFARDINPPTIIDEIQYAPDLLSPIKRLADNGLEPGAIWLTGSQNFQVMKGVRESLAGRVAVLSLFGLSDEEKQYRGNTPLDAFANILETGFPKLCGVEGDARGLYLASYTQTYIERDVRELLRIDKRREFEIFIKMAALRTGQVVNYDRLARDVGVSSATIRDWLAVLQDSFLITLVQPYFPNRNKRLIKSPKLYFNDAGIAAHLGGYRQVEQAYHGPQGGALYETHVFSELKKYFAHRLKDAEIFFWRTRDGLEIDFLVHHDGVVHPIEVKLGRPEPSALVDLEKHAEANWQDGLVISLTGPEKPVAIKPRWRHGANFKL